MFAKSLNSLRKFHTDEEGLEALQVVMIIAIAAMVLIAASVIGKAANGFMGKQSNTLINNTDLTTPEGFGGGGGGAVGGGAVGGGGGGFIGLRPTPMPPVIFPLNK